MRIISNWIAAVILASATPAAAETTVIVTSKPIHSLIAGIMTGIDAPRLLVDGNASPHTYALKPSDAKALSGARIVFRVSEHLEPFTAKLPVTMPKTARLVSLAEAPGIERLDLREGGAFEAHAHKHTHTRHGAVEDDSDPHVWLDPSNARLIAAHAAQILREAYPARAAQIEANGAELARRLDMLTSELDGLLKPVAAKPFVVFHDSLQYLEKRFGLTAVGSIMVRPDQQPSAKRLAELHKKIAATSAVCIFAEPQFPSKLIASVIEGTSAKTALIDPEGGLLTPGPDLYFELMRNTATAMRSCLQ